MGNTMIDIDNLLNELVERMADRVAAKMRAVPAREIEEKREDRIVRGHVGLAEAIGVSAQTVRLWLQEGKLDGTYMCDGRVYLYDLDKVREKLFSVIKRK